MSSNLNNEDENVNNELSGKDNEKQINQETSKLDVNKIATWCGFFGGAIFFILNMLLKGKSRAGLKEELSGSSQDMELHG